MHSQILILIVLGFGAIYVAAAPVNEPSVGTVQIIRSETEQSPDGSYKFSYELSDGQKREEVGSLKANDNGGEPILTVRGSYSYIGSDGRVNTVYYTADERGYQTSSGEIDPIISQPEYGQIDNLPPLAGIPNTALLSLVG